MKTFHWILGFVASCIMVKETGISLNVVQAMLLVGNKNKME